MPFIKLPNEIYFVGNYKKLNKCFPYHRSKIQTMMLFYVTGSEYGIVQQITRTGMYIRKFSKWLKHHSLRIWPFRILLNICTI